MTDNEKIAAADVILSVSAKTWAERRVQLDAVLAIDGEDDSDPAETAYRAACAEITVEDLADSTICD
jgi:hypothetical protein